MQLYSVYFKFAIIAGRADRIKAIAGWSVVVAICFVTFGFFVGLSSLGVATVSLIIAKRSRKSKLV